MQQHKKDEYCCITDVSGNTGTVNTYMLALMELLGEI